MTNILAITKKPLRRTGRTRFVAVASAFTCLIAVAASAGAAQLKEARVTQVVSDVKLLAQQAAPRPAAVSDLVRAGAAIRTGSQSRSELTFTDLTITRLGANTIFSFNEGTREMNLIDGAILFQLPKGSGGATIKTAAVTAAITGTTGIGEFHPAKTSNAPPFSKWLCLEGTFHLNLANGQSVEIGPGKMVTTDGKSFSKVVSFDIGQLVKTSLFFTGFDKPLASLDLIGLEEQKQLAGGFVDTTTQNPVDLTRIVDVISQADVATTTSAPIASEFGPPSVISSPVPYLITSGTVITTDPTITTNGVTDFGRIWRGPAQDGRLSAFIFGSTSAFDRRFDTELNGQNSMGGAGFKFTSLELTGDPTVFTTNGQINLALIGVNGITSGGPGGTLTFAGIRGLLLATQDGSINLGPEISFSRLHDINFYARGAGSNLILASAISVDEMIRLFAEGTIKVNGAESATNFRAFSGGDFLAGTGTVTATNIDIESLNGNVNIDGSKFPNPPTFGGSFVLNAPNGTLNVAIVGEGTPFGFDTLTGTAVTINLTSSTPITFDFSNSSSVSLAAGTGGINAPNINFVGSNLTMTSGGDINIDSFVSPSNAQGGNIPGGTINAAGAVNATGNITNVSDLTAGTRVSIGGDVGADNIAAATTINVGGNIHANTLTAGGNINALGVQVITINAPTSILTVGSDGIDPVFRPPEGAARQHTFNVDSIVSSGGIDFSGGFFGGIGGLSSGGRLTINATTITFDSATGIAFANFNGADAGSFTGGGPANGGDGGVFIVNSTGDITANNGANITATTGLNSASGVYSGAGGSVTLLSTGGMVTVNDTIQVSSDDSSAPRQSASGGTIDLQSNLTTGTGIIVGSNGQLFSLLDSNAPGPGGSILLSTKGADITIQGGTIEADRGTITISQMDPVNQTPTITIDSATLTSEILTITGAGDINLGSNSPVTLNVVTLSISAANNLTWNGGTLSATAANSDGNVDISAGNQISITGGLEIDRRFGGSSSGLNVSLDATASDLTVGNSLVINVDNSVPGNLTTGANITLSTGRNLIINGGGDLVLTIANNNGGHIGTGGDISVNVRGDLTVHGGTLDATIDNTGGNIVGNATINMNVSGSAAVNSDATFEILGSDGAAAAAININGGSYDVRATFLAHIDGNGTITFNNANIHADVLKAGVFGTNGTLTIGGGSLSGDTQLKLYAPGSNGSIDFVANVTLTEPTTSALISTIIAANKVTICNGVLVTIGGAIPALVYTNIPNYTGSGGNGTTTGRFAGVGASTLPLSQAPPFGPTGTSRGGERSGDHNIARGTSGTNVNTQTLSSTNVTSSGKVYDSNLKTTSAINLTSTDQLLSLLDAAAPGPGGKITIPASKSASNSRNPSRMNTAGRLNADRGAGDIRVASSFPSRRLPQ